MGKVESSRKDRDEMGGGSGEGGGDRGRGEDRMLFSPLCKHQPVLTDEVFVGVVCIALKSLLVWQSRMLTGGGHISRGQLNEWRTFVQPPPAPVTPPRVMPPQLGHSLGLYCPVFTGSMASFALASMGFSMMLKLLAFSIRSVSSRGLVPGAVCVCVCVGWLAGPHVSG